MDSIIRDERVRTLKILLLEPLTPLLKSEIEHAITLHSEISEHPEDTDTLYDRIVRHWIKIYGDIRSRAYLIQDITMFQQFLTAQLLQDYAKGPSIIISTWAKNQADIIQQYYEAQGNSDKDAIYRVHVAFPLEELMLNPTYIENKLLLAIRRQGLPGSYTHHLISNDDWSGLATTLTNDRDLATTLFKAHPLVSNLFDEDTRRSVLQGINQIETKYSAKLYSSTVGTYIIG